MLLSGQRPKPGHALPPSERNCLPAASSRGRYPGRVSEAAGGGAGATPPPPGPPHPHPSPSGPLSVVTLTLESRTVAQARPASQEHRRDRKRSEPSRKTQDSCAQRTSRCPHCRDPSGRRGWLGVVVGGWRTSFSERRGARRSWRKAPPADLGARRAPGPRLRPTPAPASPAAPANRRTRGPARRGRGGAALRMPRSRGRRRRWLLAARCARR